MKDAGSAAFLFAVRRLRWLARLPGFPQVFDAMLLTWTCVWRRSRLAAMEALEADLSRVPGVRLRTHRLGGTEFSLDGRELGHVHGCGLVDVKVGKSRAQALVAAGRARRHHVLPLAGWVSFQLETVADVPRAVELLLGELSVTTRV